MFLRIIKNSYFYSKIIFRHDGQFNSGNISGISKQTENR